MKRDDSVKKKVQHLPPEIVNLSNEEAKKLLHELQVHQVELEMQNEELRDMQYRLEEARDRYTDLFDFAPVGYLILDTKGVVLGANLTLCKLLAIDRKEIINKPFNVFVGESKNGPQLFFNYLKRVFEGEDYLSCELKIKRKNGDVFPAKLDGLSRLKNSRVRITISDRTTEKETEKLKILFDALIREKEKAQLYLDVAATMFILIDTQYNIRLINQKGCVILGYNEDRLIGKNWFNTFVPKKHQKEAIEAFDQLLYSTTNDFESTINHIECPDGKEVLLSCNHTQIQDEDGNVIGILCSGEDITAQKQVENELIEREKMFRTLFEIASEAIILSNEDGELISVNSKTEELFGYKKEELIGQKIEILLPKRYAKGHVKLRNHYQKYPEGRPRGNGENLVARGKDGSEFPVEISLSHYQSKHKILVMAMISDVTKQKEETQKLKDIAEELEIKVEKRTHELRESQILYEKIASNFPNGIIAILNTNLEYVFVQGKELKKLGLKHNALIGTRFLDTSTGSQKIQVEKKIRGVFRGTDSNFELTYGRDVYLVNAVGLKDKNNNVTQIMIVSHNITRHKKAEQDIKNALLKEQELNELKSRFVSMASHEFRTPLTTTMNSISILDKYIGDSTNKDKQRTQVKRIKSAVHDLTTILNDFLSMDKLEQGVFKQTLLEIDVKSLVTKLIDSLQSSLKQDQSITFKHSGKKMIVSDIQMLKGICNNILSNAIKYGANDDEISIHTTVENGNLLIFIEDHGIGVPEEEQVHLFDRFFRAKNALNIQGTGLGLNIVKRYLTLLGGEIEISSRENQGTIVKVQIPV